MASTSAGWLATRTSWPAAQKAQPSGTMWYMCVAHAQLVSSIRMTAMVAALPLRFCSIGRSADAAQL
ncbi:hypothetical protein GCM10010185_68580 [Saccharothrix coeruleofusca]|uniref:Uncharacterized protein n=1 Tax=Saccharothrix coeruleofusca TaxID=33919 RepID=A0A918AU72_9PSEU|nr:hypothetical protein GCM10010185_68580 [Saccharothrix coeruleofusca]